MRLANTSNEQRAPSPRTCFLQLVGDAKEDIIGRVVDEVVGLGPIEPLLRDPTISEVMVNGPDEVYYERDGIIYDAEATFRDEAHILKMVDRIVASIGRHVDEASPMVDARLADGSRVNVIIPPLTPRSPVVTIRKFRQDRYDMADLVRIGTLSEGMAEVLTACVKAKLNIVVSGGTGTGKTTLLNALSTAIRATGAHRHGRGPNRTELQQRHVVPMEARPPSTRGPRRGHAARPRAQRAAHAARPDHRGRSPWLRGVRHDAGDEHGPRWLAHHRARE